VPLVIDAAAGGAAIGRLQNLSQFMGSTMPKQLCSIERQ
jgi:hypothetical protein